MVLKIFQGSNTWGGFEFQNSKWWWWLFSTATKGLYLEFIFTWSHLKFMDVLRSFKGCKSSYIYCCSHISLRAQIMLKQIMSQSREHKIPGSRHNILCPVWLWARYMSIISSGSRFKILHKYWLTCPRSKELHEHKRFRQQI